MHALPPIPLDTEMCASTAFSPVHPYIRLGNQAERIFDGVDFGELENSAVLAGLNPCLVVLLTLLQYSEQLSDFQASEAVRVRTDWKYALHLPMAFLEIQPKLLCRFRSSMLKNSPEQKVLQDAIQRLVDIGFLKVEESLDLSAGFVLRSVCTVERIYEVSRIMHLVLGSLASWNADWLRQTMLPHWVNRYEKRNMQFSRHQEDSARYACSLGQDISYLLLQIESSGFHELQQMPEVQDLQITIKQHYALTDCSDRKFCWRAKGCMLCPKD